VWSFVTVETSDGLTGSGEATLNGRQVELEICFKRMASTLIGRQADGLVRLDDPLPVDLPAAAITSALDVALWDLSAQRDGVSLSTLLGQHRDRVALYANINRRTEPRTPDAFAASARHAAGQRFRAIKIAPFDEVTPASATLRNCQQGLDRIAAVRSVLPPDAQLLVDCHWRFTPALASEIIPHLAERGVSWYECPIEETDAAIPTLVALRDRANEAGLVLAGFETGIGFRAFERFARAGAYDVMMPDIKYIGSVAAMRATADMLQAQGVKFSPHNPTGPICHAASIALCTAETRPCTLEMQLDETPLFDELVASALPKPEAGHVAVPTGPGLGVALDQSVLARLDCRTTTIE
jgi:galactonate dehydratase